MPKESIGKTGSERKGSSRTKSVESKGKEVVSRSGKRKAERNPGISRVVSASSTSVVTSHRRYPFLAPPWKSKREAKAPERIDPSPFHFVRFNGDGRFTFWYKNERAPYELHEDDAYFPRDLKPGRKTHAEAEAGTQVRFSGARSPAEDISMTSRK
jgi:hypothetical protein